MSYIKFSHLLLLIFFTACSSSGQDNPTRQKHQKGEYIYRKHGESLITIPQQEKNPIKIYPWNKDQTSKFPKINKEFFRCKGSSLNPARTIQKNNETIHQYDCSGSSKHSLPLRDGKEFIYPVLIELINYIQESTGRRVVITCGHRCPTHNTYADSAPSNQYSKHTIGAEVSFYVQGLEEYPEEIIKIIKNFYKVTQHYAGSKEYEEFKTYEKKDYHISTSPCYNKEIFIKIYKKSEGRNFDNRHPYPYLSIQLRYDRDTHEKVIDSWDKAYGNFHRW